MRNTFVLAAIAAFAFATVSMAGDIVRMGSSRHERAREGTTYSCALFQGDHYDDIDGFSIGFFPMHRNIHGAEIGLIGMAADGDLHGFGYGLIVSVVEGEMHGGQFGLLASIAGKQSSGFQMSVITCMASHGFSGMQFSLFNNDAIDIHGFQLAALHNLNRGVSSGLQVGLINRAERFKGVQFGLLNIVQEFHGLQLGICNYSADSSVPVLPLVRAAF